MKTSEPKTIYLKDYQVPSFLIDKTQLLVQIYGDHTQVTADLHLRRNPESSLSQPDLVLDGAELNTVSVSVDGKALSNDDYSIDGELLTIKGQQLPEQFVLQTVVNIDPANNTSLEGFYKSGTMYCSQCEAEGFRKITWYLDRPDVMSIFTTRMEADKSQFPILLSNGNPVEEGDLTEGRHFATWEDPHKKPAYLFAMVAGDLVRSDSEFVTQSGKKVSCRLFVEAHNAEKTEFAHVALHRSMKWDEEVFGREYDLDIFMIVASDFFNMGAMENKGLNIFNSALVLAKPETTTDLGYERIEGVIGHEYFHNWSGNRVTCRDWFQLSLKEGFTVFRDAEFTADMNSRAVKRVDDVTLLRTHQFAEDASPMAHPVRPASYMEINNFYTMTIYEKGAEVVGMIHTLLGAELFRKGSDLYFDKNDGRAATIEDFVGAMAEVSGFDFSQFMLWYEQAGTPVVDVSDSYDAEAQVYRLIMKQSVPDTQGQSNKKPMLIPIKMGLLDKGGNELAIELKNSDAYNPATGVLQLTAAEQTFEFANIAEKPVPSLLRDFSAPIKLNFPYSRADLAFLMANDKNGFNRWEAGQRLATQILLEQIENNTQKVTVDPLLVDAFGAVLADKQMDKAIKARMLSLPSEAILFELMSTVDTDGIHRVRKGVEVQLAQQLKDQWLATYEALNHPVAYEFEQGQVADRALKNCALKYLALSGHDQGVELTKGQFDQANNMTDVSAAMRIIATGDNKSVRQQVMDQFYDQWQNENQMMEQWLSIQASSGDLANVKALQQHPIYDIKNPNKVRSLVGGFMMGNQVEFHKADGSGYEFGADQVIQLNSINPQIASRVCAGFRVLPKLNSERQGLMRAQVERIAKTPDLSKDVFEIVDRILKS